MTMSDDNENEQPLNLDIPDHLEYSEEHAWVDRSVDPAIIGITEYAADQLGELVFVDLPEPAPVWRPATRSWSLNPPRPSSR